MANTVTVSALTEAIDVRKDELIVKSATSSKTAKYARLYSRARPLRQARNWASFPAI